MEDTIIEQLASVDDISKRSYSAFSDARVLEILRDQKVDTVALCGVDTDACVMATALSAFDLGLRPLVLSDLCASSGGDDYHRAALMLLERNIGHRQILTSKDVMAEIDLSRG
jgi:nicotinamidase-related amidase